jgi:nitroimidazol reductase NimA-like FMN-containing flavoprotein (pyridoxamine 5'-phosphate oxidase superfamily)
MKNPVVRSTSTWDPPQIEAFLLNARIPVRLSCLSRNGVPLICSLWYLYDDGVIWCATQRTAQLIELLQENDRCGFEVAGDEPPYRGVRGQGRATLLGSEGPAMLMRLMDRYLQRRDSAFAKWLVARQDQEVAIRIEPIWLTSWDYTTRMSV